MLEAALEALAARLAPACAGQEHITRRLALTIEQPNRLGYAPHWEAPANSLRVIFEHCPNSAIIARRRRR